MMWKKITMRAAPRGSRASMSGNYRDDEEFDGPFDIEHAKILIALKEDFKNVRDMYIQNLSEPDPDSDDFVEIYRVHKNYNGDIKFEPFAFWESTIDKLVPSKAARAGINVTAMSTRGDGFKIEKLLKEFSTG